MEDMPIKNFYIWFNEGVGQWLEIAAFKALTRIEKAIDLDQFVPVDSSVKYSSSAIDTLQIFYQIKIFWQQLNWPDVEGSYIFMAKIIDVSLNIFKDQHCECIKINQFAGYL